MTTQAVPIAQTPIYPWHVAHGANMVIRNGWRIARAYSGEVREMEAARSGLALADVSASSKLSVRGRGVSALAAALAPDSRILKPLAVSCVGGANPALACRLTDDHLLLLSLGDTPFRPDVQAQSIVVTDVTSAHAGFFVLGPRLGELLSSLTHLDVRVTALRLNSCAETQFAGVEALLVRTTETSLPAMRIYVAWDMAEYVWGRMWEAGRDLAMAPLGLDGLRLLSDGSGSATN